MSRRPFQLSIIGYVLLCLSVAASVWVALKFWLERSETFPRMETGLYSGVIVSPLDPQAPPLALIVLSRAQSDQLDVAFVGSDLELQTVALKTSPAGPRGPSVSAQALELNSPAGPLRLSGQRSADGNYAGKVTQLRSGTEAAWRLVRAESGAPTLEETNLKEIRMWLSLRAELLAVELRSSWLAKKIPQQAEEIKKLDEFVTEGVGLKQRADQKFGQVQGLVKAALERLKLKQQEAKELEEKISLSQRVTPMGRLVSLGRESLQREAAWVELMFKLNPQSGDTKRIEQDYARAAKVLELKAEIRREREPQVDTDTYLDDAEQWDEELER